MLWRGAGSRNRASASNRMLSMNRYQIDFLHLLVAEQVRFLVIGGQALFFHCRRPTNDLDIWADLEGYSGQGLAGALVEWSHKNPLHTRTLIEHPVVLRPGLQIAFPEFDDVYYLTADGQTISVAPSIGIDILTSIPGHEFDEFFGRSVSWEIDGQQVRVTSLDDTHELAQLKSRNSDLG